MRQFRPSAAATWLRCNGQPALLEALGLPPSDSDAAAEGRIAHRIAAECLTYGTDPTTYIGTVQQESMEIGGTYEIEIDKEFIGHVQEYLDALERLYHGAKLEETEHELDIGAVIKKEGQKGTADKTGIIKTTLRVDDLKFGKGKKVKAKRNVQMMLYGAAMWLKHRAKHTIKRVKIAIHQPRIDGFDEWTFDVPTLKAFIARARRAVRRGMACKSGELLKPGPIQCEWCPAQAFCPKLTGRVMALVEKDIANGVIALQHQDMEELAARRRWVPLVESWAKSVCAAVRMGLETGMDVPGWKMVIGRRGNRTYSNEKLVRRRLRKWRLKRGDVYDFKLKSPTQLQKVLTPRRYEMLVEDGLIYQPEGNPTVVPDDNPKPSIPMEDAFDDLTLNDE
jgi:hypothetical protein